MFCSADAARTNSIESIFISKYPTNRSFRKYSLPSDDRTRKRMRSRHKEICYHETSMKSCQGRSGNGLYRFNVDIFISRFNEYFLTFRSRDHRDTKQEISMRMSRKEEKKLAKDYINALLRTALNTSSS
jgi:hypothetical protein